MKKTVLNKQFIKSRVLFAFCVLMMGLLGTATAQSNSEDGFRLFELGNQAFNNGRYKEALDYSVRSLQLNRTSNTTIGIALNLNLIGLIQEKVGKNDEALKSLDEALNIFKEIGKYKNAILILKKEGLIYKSLNRYDEAAKSFEEALLLEKKINAPAVDMAKSIMMLGIINETIGKNEKALSYYKDQLKIWRELSSPPDIANSLSNIGRILTEIGNFEVALKCHEEALGLRREIGEPEGISASLNNIGSVYDSMGKYNNALKYYEESLTQKRNNNLSLESQVKNLNNIGTIYRALGRYDVALKYYEEAIRIVRQSDDRDSLGTLLNGVGGLYDKLGEYEKAIKFFQEALNLREKLGIKWMIAVTHNDMGLVYENMGLYQEALKHHREALKIRRELESKRDLAQSLNNIGLVYDSMGIYKDAISAYEEALRIYESSNSSPDLALTMSNLGFVYLNLKKFQKADELFSKAEKEKAKTGYECKECAVGRVELYLSMNSNEKALDLLGMLVPSWSASLPYQMQYHTQKGVVLKATGKEKEASSEFLKAVLTAEETRKRIIDRSGYFNAGNYGGRTRAYKGLVSTLAERAIKGDKIDEELSSYSTDVASSTFYFAELTKARTLLEAMAGSAKKSRKETISADLRSQEKDILNQLSAIEDQWEDTYKKGEVAFKELVQRKEALKKELDALIVILRNKYPFYAALNYPLPIPPKELRLRHNEALIEYAVGDDAVYIFVVRKNGVKSIEKTSISRDALVEKVTMFMEPLNTGRYSGFSVKAANELYDILLSKALAKVKETDRIILVPDGILGLLPFEALVVNLGKDYVDCLYVGDKHTITYSQSATALALTRMLKPSHAKKPLFALGNPVYDKDDSRYVAYKQGKALQVLVARNLDHGTYRGITVIPKSDTVNTNEVRWEEVVYTALPETETEVKEIAKLFHTKPVSPDVLLNISANESSFRDTTVKDYRYLHFATHADLPGKVQGIKEPFLLLGQVENKAGDDGFLTLSEVLELGLDADMVVLSACSTGKGRVMEGEGVANFARAFQQAGARSVVVSLWEVASDPAVEFMAAFYGYLKKGYGRADALTLARRRIKSKYPNPFYWAVFIMHGEGEADKTIH